MDTNPESVEKREKRLRSERTRDSPACFRDSGAKGRKVEKTERVRLAAETPEERGQAARKDSRSVCTFVRKVNSVCFGGDIPARQPERSSGGLQG